MASLQSTNQRHRSPILQQQRPIRQKLHQRIRTRPLETASNERHLLLPGDHRTAWAAGHLLHQKGQINQ